MVSNNECEVSPPMPECDDGVEKLSVLLIANIKNQFHRLNLKTKGHPKTIDKYTDIYMYMHNIGYLFPFLLWL